MARKARQSFETNVVKKHDNAQTWAKQRTEAREEVGRIIEWAKVAGRDSLIVRRLIDKLSYLRDKTLREDV